MTVTTALSKLFKEGLLSERPAATDGRLWYFATDENGGTLYKAVGGSWQQVASGLSASTLPDPSGEPDGEWLMTSSGAAVWVAAAASLVPIADVGGYFATDNVEAALQQLGAAGAAGGIPQGGPLTADLDADGFTVLNLTDPTGGADQQAATKKYVDDNAGGGGAGALLAFFQQTGGTNKTTTSASLSDVDATNAAVTFTAPASGNVIVRVTAQTQITNAVQNAFFGLREGTTNVYGPTFATQGNTTFNREDLICWAAYLTGLSAGSHTYKLAFSVNGGATFTVRQIGSAATAYPVTMEVWAA